MFAKQSTITRFFYQTLVLFISLVVVLNVTSCKCTKPHQLSDRSGSLSMEVTPTSLVGNKQTTIEVIFTTNNSKKIVDLAAYQIKITLTETGGSGSSLHYIDGKKATQFIASSLQETLRHFFSTATLKSIESPLKVPFTLIPGPDVTSITIQFELLDKQDQVLQSYTANWQKGPTEAVELRISNLVYDSESGKLTYNIQNDGNEIAKQLQLRYTNTSVDEAGKTVLFDGKTIDTLTLPDIKGKNSTGDQSLVVDFKTATKATFKFEVLYQGIPVATKEQDFCIPVLQTLLTAIAQADVEQVRQLLKDPSIQVNAANEQGKTPLHKAVKNGSEEIIRLLLENGANVNYASKTGETPMHIATEKDNLNVLKLLIARGAQLNARNSCGSTPFHIAAHWGSQLTIERLLEIPGMDVNSKDRLQNTPLHSAILEKQAGVIEVLLAHGANVNAKNEFNATPLHYACLHSDLANIEVAIEKLLETPGIDINAQDKSGNSPLHKAVQHKNKAMIKLLLDKGAQRDIKNNRLKTPWDLAVESGDEALKNLF